MYDPEIRLILKQYYKNKLLVDEVNVGRSRIDLIDLSTELHGIEIKSEHDNFKRLKLQMKNYNKYFSKISIVVHESKEEEVFSHVPHFWGITVIYNNKSIVEKRQPLPNPYCNKSLILTLLWKEELVNILSSKYNVSNRGRYSQMPKWKLLKLLQKEVDLLNTIDLVKSQLTERYLKGNWR
jgi:hypothetical protein